MTDDRFEQLIKKHDDEFKSLMKTHDDDFERLMGWFRFGIIVFVALIVGSFAVMGYISLS